MMAISATVPQRHDDGHQRERTNATGAVLGTVSTA
jgi:hypothetical protein